MCGVAGLFIGCSTATTCPKSLTASLIPDSDEGGDYRSPFDSWSERSTVRSAPRRILDSGDTKQVFSADLVPLARHDLVRELPAEVMNRILAQHLYRYLTFTITLEQTVVNPIALGIAHATLGVRVPARMAFDAYRIYCDEAYHAVFSADLIQQVHSYTGIEPRSVAAPYFVTRLRQIQATVSPELRPVVELLFVVCSETLISATLANVPEDPLVHAAVRDSIRDHAQDEGRHHVYFAAFLRQLWHQLDPGTRRDLGPMVPELIMAFLQPDLREAEAELLGYGLTRDATEQVLAEVYDEYTVRDYARATARLTVRHFAALDLLDDPATADRFHASGLIDGVTL
ncbi:diiron oxygenase [Nocardia salmonicida]